MTRVVMKCTQCGAEYELGLNFCKKCESILEAIELEESPPSTKTFSKSISLPKDTLKKEVVKKKEEVKEIREEIQRSLIKAVIKEILLIKEERERYNKLLRNLEEKKGEIPEDLYNKSKSSYENNLMEVANRFKELKATYTGLKERVHREVQSLEKELITLKEDLSELQRMPKAAPNLFRGKTDLKVKERSLGEEINTKEENLKEKRRLQDLLALKEKQEGLNRRAIAIAVVLLLVIVTGYGITKILYREPDTSSSQTVPPSSEEANLTGVKELLEKIKRANLGKDIVLFSSCYSPDYEGINKRKEKALALWKNFDFINLEYNLKDSIIKEKEGTIRVSWDIKVRSHDTGEVRDIKNDLTVFLIKDGDLWKIRRVIKEKG